MREAHALIVRPVGSGFEIISGHHRKFAAERAGLDAVPCWVREMDDATAYMALALNNAQGELSPLEVGLHALHSGLSGREYARQVGIAQQTLVHRINAARVAERVTPHGVDDRWRHLAEIHPSPRWLWRALVAAMVAPRREASRRMKKPGTGPGWRLSEGPSPSTFGSGGLVHKRAERCRQAQPPTIVNAVSKTIQARPRRRRLRGS